MAPQEPKHKPPQFAVKRCEEAPQVYLASSSICLTCPKTDWHVVAYWQNSQNKRATTKLPQTQSCHKLARLLFGSSKTTAIASNQWPTATNAKY